MEFQSIARWHVHCVDYGIPNRRQTMSINYFALANAFLLAAGMVYLVVAF